MTGTLLTYLKAHKAKATLAVLLAAGTILAGIGLMTSSGYLISRAAERPMIVDLFMVTAAVRFFGISRAVVRYFERVVSHDLTFKILMNIRTAFYRKLNSFPEKWFMTKRPGELLTAMISDIETLQNVYLRIMAPVMVAAIICTLTFGVLLFIDGTLAVVVLCIFMMNGLLVPALAAYLSRETGKKDRKARGSMNVFLVDRIQGLHDVLWLGKKKEVLEGFGSIQHHISEVQHKNAATSGLVEGLNTLLANLASVATVLLAIPLVLGGELQAVMLAAMILGVFSSFEALQGLSNAFVQHDGFREASNKLNALTRNGHAADDTHLPSKKNLQGHPGISFRHVSFSYQPEQNFLDDISLELRPGSRTALVGPTGSGKSTVINLLCGFWMPDEGGIYANDVPLQELNPDAYRSALSVVSQDTFIFNRSVRENLQLADARAGDLQLRQILKKVGLDALASNLDAAMGSQGMSLSGGERQLFALARALLRKSNIWVFDELSANMDARTERKILDILWETLGDRTLLTVTHRLLDMDRMDQILVITKGSISERGTHKTLLRDNAVYAKMYRQQMEVIRA
ncbi:MAG: thiol reductant ABC exporter subunit CydC [Bacteroidales bacterium]|nr:thiol reductant ABC exporter subunit CydC [Bacteroidales bacterium]